MTDALLTLHPEDEAREMSRNPHQCPRCSGLLHLDTDPSAPALVCWQGGHRIELNLDGTIMVIADQNMSIEEKIKLKRSQGRSIKEIAMSLGCSIDLVQIVIA